MRLRSQYTLVIGGLVSASLLVLGAALLVEQRRYAQEVGAVAAENLSDTLERQIEREGFALASALAGRLVSPLYHSDLALVVHEAEEQYGYRGVVSALVVDAEANVIRDAYAEDSGPQRLDLACVREALSSGEPASEHEPGRLHVAAPVTIGGHILGAAVLEMATDSIKSDIQVELVRLDGLMRTQSTAFTVTGLGIGVMLLTLVVLSAIGVAGGLSGPIVAFALRARSIGAGELVESGSLPRLDEIGDLSRAFDEMASTLKRTTVSKDHFDNVLRSMAEMLIVVDADGRIVTANPSCLAELDCSGSDLQGRPVADFLPAEALDADAPAADPGRWFELRRPGGGHVPVRVSVAPLRDSAGVTTGYVLVMRNVAERLAAEQVVARSLVEKEILLREIHHRVKNNLQIISSMLSLQAARSSDADTREVFHESEVRIRAMALVHEQLYRSGDLAHVNLEGYLGMLARQVIRYFGRNDCRVDVHVDEAVREVNVDQAIPIGLIVNELVANSIRHGFPPGRGGHVDVRLVRTPKGRRLSVTDDGTGYPADLDLETADSLGLKLVQALAEQLGGKLSMKNDGGAQCVLELPPASPPVESLPPSRGAATGGKDRTTA